MAEAWSSRGQQRTEATTDHEPGGYGGVALQIVDAMTNTRPR